MFRQALLAVLLIAASAADCKYQVTQEAHKRATRLIKGEADRVAALPDLRNGSMPIAKIHPPGSYVHGTVVIFHGYSSNAGGSARQADALFKAGFNAYAVNLPGFAQTPDYWPSATLREGYSAARSALLNDSRISSMLGRLAAGEFVDFAKAAVTFGSQMPIVQEVIRAKLPQTTADGVLRAFDLLSSFAPSNSVDFVPAVNKYFYSDHLLYDAVVSHLVAVQPLPGPLFLIGFSLGGQAAVNVAARSRAAKGAVLLAPYFGRRGAASDFNQFFNVAGVLDLFSYDLFGQKVTPRSGAAATLATQLTVRDSGLQAARESTRMLCIFAEDDTALDIALTREVCDSKLGGRSLIYPATFGLNHFITPEFQHKYTDALMEQIVSFFVNGTASQSGLLQENRNRSW